MQIIKTKSGREYLKGNTRGINANDFLTKDEACKIAQKMTEEDKDYIYRIPNQDELLIDFVDLNLINFGYKKDSVISYDEGNKIHLDMAVYHINQFSNMAKIFIVKDKDFAEVISSSRYKSPLRLIREKKGEFKGEFDTPISDFRISLGENNSIEEFKINKLKIINNSIIIDNKLNLDIENIDITSLTIKDNVKNRILSLNIYLKSGRELKIYSYLNLNELRYLPKIFNKKEEEILKIYKELLNIKIKKTF